MTGIHPNTIIRGNREIKAGPSTDLGTRVRRPGAGRPLMEVKYPKIEKVLSKLVEPKTAGDPCSKKKWVRCGLTELASQLTVKGYQIGRDTIGRLLKKPTCQFQYPNSNKLLLLCDAGGSNNYRSRVWKYELQTQLVDLHKLTITVCHYPRGASKWNPIEHRLFGPVSNNWSGEPLTTLGKMMSLIRGTKGVDTTTSLDRHAYPLKEKITDEQMAALNMTRHRVCPEWNYTIAPRINNRHRSGP